MLLNLSNHPSAEWCDHQKKTAHELYGWIEDMAFPDIDPALTLVEIRRLTGEYETIIREVNPDAVHIMGEHSFTYGLVSRLEALGTPCIASTTERIVHKLPDGSVTRSFRFIQFRPYF